MVIVRSQSRAQLINANRIAVEQLDEGRARITNINSCSELSVDFDWLGEYCSWKRALEVLDEIQNAICDIKLAEMGSKGTVVKFIFEMPAE